MVKSHKVIGLAEQGNADDKLNNQQCKMKQILFIPIIWVMLPFHGHARKPYHESDTIPKGFECFQINDRQSIFIEYTVPVNGYSVKAMRTAYNVEGKQQEEIVFHFENEETNSKFFVRTNNFYYYDNCFTDEETTKSEEVIICENEPPCAFIDVDFDEKEELVIYCYEHCLEVYNLEKLTLNLSQINRLQNWTKTLNSTQSPRHSLMCFMLEVEIKLFSPIRNRIITIGTQTG